MSTAPRRPRAIAGHRIVTGTNPRPIIGLHTSIASACNSFLESRGLQPNSKFQPTRQPRTPQEPQP